MADMTVHKDVGASAERVWAVVADLDRAADVMAAIEKIERLDSGTGFEVGTRWRETRTMFGRTATEVMEVTHIEPGVSYTVESDAAGAHYTSTVSVESFGDHRSRVTMTFSAEAKGLLGKVMAATVGRLFRNATRKALDADLEDIKAAAERR